jgi:hypothetical protein
MLGDHLYEFSTLQELEQAVMRAEHTISVINRCISDRKGDIGTVVRAAYGTAGMPTTEGATYGHAAAQVTQGIADRLEETEKLLRNLRSRVGHATQARGEERARQASVGPTLNTGPEKMRPGQAGAHAAEILSRGIW